MRRIVHATNCPCDELSGDELSATNCPATNCPATNCPPFEKKTHKKIQDKFANIPRYLVQEYIKRCERCAEKRRRRETASGVVIHPLTVKDLNERGQVDLVDMQTNKDGNYRFILLYIEYLTKFHVIRPL